MELENLEETQYLYEMAEVDRVIIGSQLYIVDVFADEGDYKPHFHLHPKGGSKRDDIVIRIDVPEYFLHGVYNKTLNSKERKELISELKSEFRGMSLYIQIKELWNRLHRNAIYDGPMPDYNELPTKNQVYVLTYYYKDTAIRLVELATPRRIEMSNLDNQTDTVIEHLVKIWLFPKYRSVETRMYYTWGEYTQYPKSEEEWIPEKENIFNTTWYDNKQLVLVYLEHHIDCHDNGEYKGYIRYNTKDTESLNKCIGSYFEKLSAKLSSDRVITE